MAITKPTAWSDWTGLPILALPSINGYELYEAIRERIEYLFPDSDTSDMPSALEPMLEDFNPTEDYKVMERRMHEAVTELIPWYRNWTQSDARLWTETDLLAALEEDERLEPNPYFLSAKWLKQMFRIVNYLRKKENIISITWIDEAESGYTSGTTYDNHKAMFEEAIGFYTAVIQPGGGNSGQIFGSSGRPSNVLYYSCDRDPCNSMSPFVMALNTLKSQYFATKYTIGLFVDTSGSMSMSTIQPAYDNFVAYINEFYPASRLVERAAGNEAWLIWTKEYIDQLSFNFEFKEEDNV
ncbi:MAG: hypothetical protein PHV82_10985 [Victivallaceae bacterium]|nr:hypothetical protein [Victivallaceae bacterium]